MLTCVSAAVGIPVLIVVGLWLFGYIAGRTGEWLWIDELLDKLVDRAYDVGRKHAKDKE